MSEEALEVRYRRILEIFFVNSQICKELDICVSLLNTVNETDTPKIGSFFLRNEFESAIIEDDYKTMVRIV